VTDQRVILLPEAVIAKSRLWVVRGLSPESNPRPALRARRRLLGEGGRSESGSHSNPR
jgi:hypothetical protein